MPYILIVIVLSGAYSGAGLGYEHPAPTVTMQEFRTEKACLFAGNEIKRRTTVTTHAVCVPKG